MTILFPGVAESTVPSTKVTNSAVPAQAIASTRTYVTGSKLAVPNGGLSVGSKFKFKVAVGKTAAGVAASIIDVAIGLLGTTADAATVSFTTGTQTAAADEAVITVEGTITAISATAGGVNAEGVILHNLAATGFAATQAVVANSAVANADTSLATAQFIGLCITGGAANVLTAHLVSAELSDVTTGAPNA